MEQITKRDGVLYYGETPCKDENDAYDWFHDEYNERMGKSFSLYLENIMQRTERIHEFGFVRLWNDKPERENCFGRRRTKYRLMGLIGIHYCRIFGMWDYPKLTDEEFERWFEWAMTRGNDAVVLVERKSASGRTSKNLKRRYR